MLCQICNKNPATIHVQEIVNGEKKVFHLCGECAEKKAETEPILQSFNLAEMLYNFTNQNMEKSKSESEQETDGASAQSVRCASCGWDGGRFRKTGRLGCPDCYLAFSPILADVLENMHRGCTHLGKTPRSHAADPAKENVIEKVALRKQIADCQRELEVRIKNEEYEEAAILRDKIQELKKRQEEPHAE